MAYFKSTLKYIKDNILYLAVFAIIPALFYAAGGPGANIYTLIDNISRKTQNYSFKSIYVNFSIINYNSVVLSLLTIIATVLFVALALAFIEKHMRIGKRTLRGVFSKLNDNIIPTLLLMGMFVLIYELWAVIISAVTVVAALVFESHTAMLVCAILIIILFVLVLFIALAMFVLWLPCLLITGFTYLEAFVYSFGLMWDNKNKIITSLLIPYIAVAVITGVLQGFAGVTASYVVLVVSFIFFFMYYTGIMYVIYFDLAKEKREDLKKKYY